MIQTRRHTLRSDLENSIGARSSAVTMARMPWEPAETATGYREETAPKSRMIKRNEPRRVQNVRGWVHISAIKAAICEVMEEME